MKNALHISSDLALPADTVTSTLIVYGAKGMGKTNFGTVLAEELARVGQRFSVLDPIGCWHGLQHDASGKKPGIEVLVLGGRHGNIPIEPTGGAVVADLVADEDVSTVVDISRHANGTMWSLGERFRFVTAYATRLYERQGERRRPLMQVIDEAGRFVPQTIPHGSPDIAACVGAIERLVEEGRNVGVGVCLITQRSARMNKSVSELADCMIAFRTVGPRSVEAILDWFGEHVEKSRWKLLVEQLRELPRGTALVVSPGWLKFEGAAGIRARTTFDSSATPTAGGERRATGKAATPDLDKYRARMAETIERAKADDPKELKRQVADLKKQVAAKTPAAAPAKAERVEVPVFTKAELELIADARARVSELCDEFREISRELLATQAKIEKFAVSVDRVRAAPAGTSIVHRDLKPANVIVGKHAVHAPKSTRRPPADGNEKPLGAGERAILTAIAQHPGGCTPEHLTVLLGYKRSSRNTYLQKLSSAGLVERVSGKIVATDAGLARLGPEFEPLPTGKALRDHWLEKLPEGERRILEILVADYPQSVNCEGIDEMTGYKRSSRNTYLQKLSSRELIERPSIGAVRASAMLFDGGA